MQRSGSAEDDPGARLDLADLVRADGVVAAAAPRIAWRALIGLAAVKLGLHLLSSTWFAYGYMTDELYYLDCAARLAWGYVDHPPLSVALLALLRALLGDSIPALRFIPALAGALVAVLVGVLAHALGGGRTAQLLAALAAVVSPVFLGIDGFYSMNALEPLFWAVTAYVLVRVAAGASASCWLAVGAVIGLGLLNKLSMLWLGAGIAAGLLATSERRWLRSPWPWMAGVLAIALLAPHLVWQQQHGWPTIEFLRNAAQRKLPARPPLAFAAQLLLLGHPLVAPLWVAGACWYFTGAGRPYRVLGVAWVVVVGALMATGQARSNYLAPTFVLVLPAGGVAIERVAARLRWRWLPVSAAVLFVAGGLAVLPLAIEFLPPPLLIRYQHALGITPPAEEIDPPGVLPLHFALKFHARAVVDAVSRAWMQLSADERTHAGILGTSFGESAAVNFFGPAAGLPRAIGTHNNYWLWGPQPYDGDLILAIARDEDGLHELFGDVQRAANIDCPYCMPALSAKSVYICRHSRRPLPALWPQLKDYW